MTIILNSLCYPNIKCFFITKVNIILVDTTSSKTLVIITSDKKTQEEDPYDIVK